MKHYHRHKLALAFSMAICCSGNAKAQLVTEEKLIGCWKVTHIEFLHPMRDSTDLQKETKNYQTCFEKGMKFVTTNGASKDSLVGSGSYHIGENGKSIYENGDTRAEVTALDETHLALRVMDDLVLYYERIKSPASSN